MSTTIGWAMAQNLPLKDFRWLSQQEIDALDIVSCDIEGKTGYVLEVDLDYPEHLHDLHNDYCLAPERLLPSHNILSTYQRELKNKLNIPKNTTQKLIPNLLPKTKYTLHFKNLQLYLKNGLILKKIHRVVSFTQERWLKPYIDFNTEKRKAAKTPEEKDAFKLFVNSVFGRSCMNIRKHRDVRIVHDTRRAKNLIAKPNYSTYQIINDDLVAINMKKTHIFWNKPTFLGFSILDISKTLMYQYHYDHILPLYGDKAKLLLTDTDSFIYHIHTEDLYDDMRRNLDVYDTSDYDACHPCYSKTNCKVLGKFKDECGGIPAVEFIGLRSKMYSVQLDESGRTKHTAKGIKKSTANTLTHANYKACLQEHTTNNVTFNTIKSSNHTLKTTKIVKSGLNPFDDKRYLRPDSHDTWAYGHWRTKEDEEEETVRQ